MGDSSPLSSIVSLHLLQHNEDCLCLLACLAALVVSEPRFRKLEEMEQRLGCSILEITKCQKEIETAFEDCSHISDMVSIQTCINDILAMTDCQKCICDVLPIC